MPTFALISEGETDHVVLDHLIQDVCEEHFEEPVDVNPLQPLRGRGVNSSAHFGGWGLVFEYCRNSITTALATNDFVVIHLDTDEGDHPNYGLSLTYEGRDRCYQELVVDAADILIENIGPDIYAAYSDRIIFAIAVHSMESWLLYLHFGKNEIKGSWSRLQHSLRLNGLDGLKKQAISYDRLMRINKKKRTKECMTSDTSLALFLCRLADLR